MNRLTQKVARLLPHVKRIPPPALARRANMGLFGNSGFCLGEGPGAPAWQFPSHGSRPRSPNRRPRDRPLLYRPGTS